MYEIIPTSKFKEDIKYYKIKKRFLNIEDYIDKIVSELEKSNLLGDPIDDLKLPEGEGAYKVRAANTDTKVGNLMGIESFIML